MLVKRRRRDSSFGRLVTGGRFFSRGVYFGRYGGNKLTVESGRDRLLSVRYLGL